MDNILSEVKTAFDLFRESINLFKAAKECLPNSSEKQAAEKTLAEAELSAKVAEAKLAQSLGFLLCPKCWPPSILRATSVNSGVDLYNCISCNSHYANHGKRRGAVNLREYNPDQSDQQEKDE
jgi:hypothetical protein